MDEQRLIIVSKHAIDRLRQRFRLRFPKEILDSDFATRNLIVAQVNSGVEITRWKSEDYYAEMVKQRYGEETVVYMKSNVYFVCAKVEGNKLIVRTVVKEWYMEHRTNGNRQIKERMKEKQKVVIHGELKK